MLSDSHMKRVQDAQSDTTPSLKNDQKRTFTTESDTQDPGSQIERISLLFLIC